MSEAKYKLCKRAGLKVFVNWHHMDAIHAADVEKLLAGAPVVRARLYDNEVFGEWFDKAHEQDTHTARLVMIEPIKPKSLEDKILEVLDDHSKSAIEALTAIRRLLEGK